MQTIGWTEGSRRGAREARAVPEGVRYRIAHLPIRFRHFLEMDLLEGRSEREICALLEIGASTCRTLRRLAFSALRASLRAGER